MLEKASQLGSCDYQHDGKVTSLRLSTAGDYRGRESLVIRLFGIDEEQELRFYQDLGELERALGNEVFIFLQAL